jgi:Helix-turn-helix domain
VAPADSLARLRKTLLDRAERREVPVTQLCRETGISRSRFYELRTRYRAYGEAGLRPKPRPAERSDRRLAEPLRDAIVAYAVEHPTHGERTIALVLATPRYGGWRVSHGGLPTSCGGQVSGGAWPASPRPRAWPPVRADP